MSMVTRVTGTRSGAGDDVAVIPAPSAAQEIQIYFVQVHSEGATPVTVLVKGGATVLDRSRLANDGAQKMRQYTNNNSLRCGAGNPVFLNLDVGAAVGYVLEYIVVG